MNDETLLLALIIVALLLGYGVTWRVVLKQHRIAVDALAETRKWRGFAKELGERVEQLSRELQNRPTDEGEEWKRDL